MTNTTRPLSQIAREIVRDWKSPYFGAVPYLEAMLRLNTINDSFGHDEADDIVRYFLSNAATWRGETARRVKVELKAMLKATLARRASGVADTQRADLAPDTDTGSDLRPVSFRAAHRAAYLAGDAARYEAEMIEEACWRVYDYEKDAYLGLVRDPNEYYEVTDFGCADYVAYALNHSHARQLLGKGRG